MTHPDSVVVIPLGRDISKVAARYEIPESRVKALDVPLRGIYNTLEYFKETDKMRLTATDKAIGELNMRRADIERATTYLESRNGVDVNDLVHQAVKCDLADIDRCIELLRAVAPAPKLEKVAKVGKPRKARKGAAEVEG